MKIQIKTIKGTSKLLLLTILSLSLIILSYSSLAALNREQSTPSSTEYPLLIERGLGWDIHITQDGKRIRTIYPGTIMDTNGKRRPFTEATSFREENQLLRLEWNGKSVILDPYIVYNGKILETIPDDFSFTTAIQDGKTSYKWSHVLNNHPNLQSVGFKIVTNEEVTPVNTLKTEIIPTPIIIEGTEFIINETFRTGWIGLRIGEQTIVFNDLIESGFTVDISFPYIEIGNLSGKGSLIYLDPIITPTGDDNYINEDTYINVSASPYYINDTNDNGVLIINNSDIFLDCNTSIFIGTNVPTQKGITAASPFNNVTIRNCEIQTYRYGIEFSSNENNTIHNNVLSSNFIGILTVGVKNSIIFDNKAESNTYGYYMISSSNNNSLINNTAISGSSGFFIVGVGNHNNTFSKNIANNNAGLGFRLDHSTYNIIDNNMINSNTLGGILFGSDDLFNTISNNEINSNNDYGIVIEFTSHNNLIINNTIKSNAKNGIKFIFNANDNNLTSNIICFNPLDIHNDHSNFGDLNTCNSTFRWNDTGTIGCTFTCSDSLEVTDMIPIQVIEDVDLILGKRTLVRTVLDFNQGSDNITRTATLEALYLDGIPQTFTNHSNPTTLIEGSNNFLDVFFIPQQEGQSLEIISQISSTVPSFQTTNISRQVNVTETREFNVTFVPVQTFGLHWGSPINFQSTVKNSTIFLNKTYPVSDTGLKVTSILPMIDYFSFFGGIHTLLSLPILASEVQIAAYLSGEYHERSVGVVKEGFFSTVVGAQGYIGYAIWSNGSGLTAVIIEDRTMSVTAHELGHTYELCDESDGKNWDINNNDGTSCPNGDLDGNGSLDDVCLHPGGCPTYSLSPLTNKSDSTTLYDFMGSAGRGSDEVGIAWVANDSFPSLLDSFSHESPVFTEKRLLISGTFNKTDGTAKFNPFYELGSGLAINTSEISGGMIIELKNSTDDVLFSMDFDLSFILFGNGTIEINESPFVFVIPFPGNVTTINLIENSSIKDQVNVTLNTPNITIVSPNGGEHFSNEEINITWNASDEDGDNLTFAVLFSPDNGTTFFTLISDLNETSLVINSSVFPDSKLAMIKVLVTDGVNTENDTSDNVFEIDNDLNITSFRVVYENSTQRIFEINLNNTLITNITTISWQLDTGENVETSIFNFGLKPSEQIFVYLYHNYSTTGNFTLTYSAFTNNLQETEYLVLEVS